MKWMTISIWYSFAVLLFCFPNSTQKYTNNLAGEWRFKLDSNKVGEKEQWFSSALPGIIKLPGSCAEGGYGVKPDKPYVGRITPLLKYEGWAWYQRDIEVPAEWGNKRLELFLERCHWESSIWLDDKEIGTQNSLSAPHIYDLGQVKPGRHRLTIRIDNTYKIPIGTWGNAITEDTQGNWNGIIGTIELRATDPVWIKNVQVYPKLLKISIGNQTGRELEVTLQSRKFHIHTGGSVVDLPYDGKGKLWDEFNPKLGELTINLKAGKWNDKKTIMCAVRNLDTKNKQFILNGRPIILRGPVDECVYPKTGYPPMDKASWLRVLNICKSYGFNFMRFHSWCPPAAAFEAADELGFLFQIELPLWTMDAPPFGKHPIRDQFIRDELDLILNTYGNHPSFALIAMGNESTGSLDTLVKIGRAKDNRHLYRCENGDDKSKGDYFEIGLRGVIGPRTNWDRWSVPGWIVSSNTNVTKGTSVPTLAHETGQWAMYPDFDEIKKYTGIFHPYNFESYRNSLEAHNMLDQEKAFAKASGKFSVQLYKDEIEASLRTYPYGGFQVLEARDYPGQGTAIVGWLDAFWDTKGLISPEEFSRFCAPTVCLLRMPKRIYTTNESFVASAEIAHYGKAKINVHPTWQITGESGNIIASGKLPAINIQTGCVTSLGEINTGLNKVAAPAKLIVTLSAGGTSNSWNIWVYPDKIMETPKNIHISYSFDKETQDALLAGESVLLFSSPKQGIIKYKPGMLLPDSLRNFTRVERGKNAIPGSFTPMFWNIRLFNQIGTLGILCDPKHPALAEFPTEEHSDWQWADLLGNFSAANSFRVAGAPKEMADNLAKGAGDVSDRSKAIILDDTPPEFKPIVQIIDNYDRNSKLGTIFEARVGNGKLLVCAMDLDTDAANRPAARQLRQSLMKYVGSNKFTPATVLSIELLEKLLL